jgi:hypothetical protein
MSCNFSAEVYALHALGLSESPERDELNEHLQRECSTCVAALREASEFWSTFGAVDQGAVPPPELRQRILQSVQPLGRRRAHPIRMWGAIAAGVVIVVGASTTAWMVGHSQRIQQAALPDQTAEIQRLEAENRTLRDRRVEPLPTPPVAPAPPMPKPVIVQDPALLRELEELKTLSATTTQALAEERSKLSDLEKQLGEKNTALAAATRSRDEALQRAAQEKERATGQREAELATYRARIRELEGQVVEYRRTIDSQRQRVEQNLQLTSMLQSPSVMMVRLRATEAGQNAAGVALIADNSRVMFYSSNLPPLPAGRTYQLWLIRARGPAIVSAGTFTGSTVQFASAQLVPGVTAVAVTEEPAGGSPLPTGHKLLLGTTKG